MSLINKKTDAEKKRELTKLKDKINRDAKYNILHFASDLPSPYLLRRPTGIMPLDLELGGGWPAGGVVYVSGPENAGKSFILYKTYAMIQRIHGKNSTILHIQAEGAPDYFYMRACGFKVAIPKENIEQLQDIRKQRGLPPLPKEQVDDLRDQIGDVIISTGKTMEDNLQAALDFGLKNLCQAIGIDSISSLVPSAEAQLQFDQFAQQGAHATLMKRFFLHYYPVLSGVDGVNETTLICTNQVVFNRDKANAAPFMQKFIKDWKPAGSPAAKHGKLIDVSVYSGAKEKEGAGGEKIAIGKDVNFETTKGKAGTHDNKRGSFSYRYGEDPWLMNARLLLVSGIQKGLLGERDGKIVHIPTGDVMGPADHVITKIREDQAIEMQLRNQILEIAGIQCTYT